MSFSSMKKNSGKTDSLMDQLNKIQSSEKKDFNDPRFWKPGTDPSDSGYAVIRFLPACDGEDTPWVRVFNHGFKGKGGWYIENCPTTIGGKCPLCEANSLLWNSGSEIDKEIARGRKRRLSYIANIMVIEDPKNPDNNGKVFLYKFGKKIFDKITESLQPEFADEEPVNPFDLWKGANFKIKIKHVAGFVNYDKSEFASPSALDDDDKVLENIWKSQYKLQEFVDPDQFKSYDDLKSKLNSVISGGGRNGDVAESVEDLDNVVEKTRKEQFSPKNESSSQSGSGGGGESDDEDDALAYFRELTNDS